MLGASEKCNLPSAQLAQGIIQDQNTQTLKCAGGYATVATTTATLAHKDVRDFTGSNYGSAQPTYKDAYDTCKGFASTDALKIWTYARPELTALKNSAMAKAAFKKNMLGSNKPYSSADDETGITEQMEQRYGPTGSFEKKTWQKVDDEQIDKAPFTECSGEDTKLSAITDIDTLSRALSYYSETTIQRKATKTAATEKSTKCSTVVKDQKQSPSKEECKEQKTKEPCEVAGCKFDKDKQDEEKCLPDPEAKTEKKDGEDGKHQNTNTTGSNSIVIRNTPHVLAFLLL
ncbi:Trypanosome variant surface glycoprotein (A-type), putative [Trypanosoma equiperdum]|uniref:Trypanosome variant surface glycoprotein (A-type), putative n=1 Tax=Trypanosoma equiperdum TaxID=5694 RepID=A0A1G4HZ56_TRYEQ|nr:Trypanosome variant surface glycoprotein (A-type), putative [Trypanosoma equiperdum]